MTTSSALHRYLIGDEFKQSLVRDYRRFEILAERGLQSSVQRLVRRKLRGFGGTATGYRVSCETRLGSKIPDLIVWKNGKPRFFIECKDTSGFKLGSARKDWEKLKTLCPEYASVKGGYLIYVARKRDKDFESHVFVGKHRRVTLVKIILAEHFGKDFAEWEAEYTKRAHYEIPAPKLSAKAASA